jgi:hypothetical protein
MIRDMEELEFMTAVDMKSSVFSDITPCSPAKVQPMFRGNISPLLLPASCWFLAFTPNMEATCSSETTVDFHRTIRGYIPEDETLCKSEFHG